MNRRAVELSLAADALANLESYTRTPSPPRPLEVEDLSDQALIDKVRFVSASSRQSAADLELVRMFAEWRYQILRAESADSGRVESLIYLIGKVIPVASEFREQAEDLRRLREFLFAEWGIEVRSPMSFSESRDVAYRASLDLVALPNALRTLSDVSTVSTGSRSKRDEGPTRVGWASEYEQSRND
jgi:hypothetical protein